MKKSPTPRERAAYWMLLSLAKKAALMVKLLPRNVDRGCPKHIMWVTWGIGKTDPWNRVFHMRCDDAIGRKPRFRSLGPDGKLNTADDILGWKPLVTAKAGCASGCERLARCKPKTDKSKCMKACTRGSSTMHFNVDTCGRLRHCTDAAPCVKAALQDYTPMASCKSFGRAAARTFGGTSAQVTKLTRICNADMLRTPELLCVESSKNAREAALCHLTVNRNWPTNVGAKP